MTGTEFLGTILAGALNTLWIAGAVAATAWALGRFVARRNAATRHLLWWIVLAFVLLLPLAGVDRDRTAAPAPAPAVDSQVAVPAAPTATAALATPAAPTAPARSFFPLHLDLSVWPAVALALWLLFAMVQFARIAWSFLYLRRLKRRSSPAPAALVDRLQYWMAACGVKRRVRLLVSTRISSPLATGTLRPAVILPASLLEHFREGEFDHVLLHELAHIARRDDWSNLLARVVGALAGLHPAAAWSLHQIARERELACDEWVVAWTGEARPYAASLARLFEVCRGQRRMLLATGMAGKGSRLGERIESLLAGGRQFSARASLLRVAAGCVALVLLVAAGAQAPHWVVLAQNKPAPEQPPEHSDRPVNPHGSYLAALVAAGYGNLSVDDIISLKDHGIDAQFLAGLSKSGWEKLSARDLIAMRDHGVPPEMLRALHDAGYQHIDMNEVIHAYEQGVRPETLKNAAPYGTRLTLAQVVRLKQAGVIQ